LIPAWPTECRCSRSANMFTRGGPERSIGPLLTPGHFRASPPENDQTSMMLPGGAGTSRDEVTYGLRDTKSAHVDRQDIAVAVIRTGAAAVALGCLGLAIFLAGHHPLLPAAMVAGTALWSL